MLANATIPVLLPVVFLNISVAPREIEMLFSDADWLAPAPTPNPKLLPCCSYVSCSVSRFRSPWIFSATLLAVILPPLMLVSFVVLRLNVPFFANISELVWVFCKMKLFDWLNPALIPTPLLPTETLLVVVLAPNSDWKVFSLDLILAFLAAMVISPLLDLRIEPVWL